MFSRIFRTVSSFYIVLCWYGIVSFRCIVAMRLIHTRTQILFTRTCVVYVRKYVGSSSSTMADDVSTSILVKRSSISRDCLWLLILEILKIAQEILYLWHSNVSFFLFFKNEFCCCWCNYFFSLYLWLADKIRDKVSCF